MLYYNHDKGCHVVEVAKNNNGKVGDEISCRRIGNKQRFEEIISGHDAPPPSPHYSSEDF
jgi:hypothetical protein